MENNKCEECVHWDECEIKIILHNPLITTNFYDGMYDANFIAETDFKIKKGDRIAQIMLQERKSYLFGIECEDERCGGFGSTNKEIA